MKTVNHKPIFVLALFTFVVNIAFSQSENFKMDKGKAINQRTFALQGKTPTEVYKDINRWLVKYYRDPEENLKARIDGEYLRGLGYYPGFIKSGSLTASDLQYTFIFEINEQGVEFTITDVVIVHDSSQDVNSVYRLEEYFKPSKKKIHRRN